MSFATDSAAWKALQAHFDGTMKDAHMRQLFAADPTRFAQHSLDFEGKILVDFSKNIATAETMTLLRALAADADVSGWAHKMFSGEKINNTEGRAVLHVALRNRANTPIFVDGADVMPGVNAVLAKMEAFVNKVRTRAAPRRATPRWSARAAVGAASGPLRWRVVWTRAAPRRAVVVCARAAVRWRQAVCCEGVGRGCPCGCVCGAVASSRCARERWG
jgi:hypothetical protein